MFLPRDLIARVYIHLQNSCHALSSPVLILVALEPDAVCACRIFTRLLRHDYIQHKIVPVPGYADLERIGKEFIAPMMKTRGGQGGIVVCLGVGGMADLGVILGLEPEDEEETFGGVEVWVVDSHRPWNLSNVFSGVPLEPETETATTFSARLPHGVRGGRIEKDYRPGKGGIIVLDDGDIEEDLKTEKEAFLALCDMPEIEDNGESLGESDDDESEDEDAENGENPAVHAGTKRKSWSLDNDDSDEDDRPRQRRRSNSSSPIPDSPRRPAQRGLISRRDDAAIFSDDRRFEPPSAAQGPSARTLRRRLLRLKRENQQKLEKYYRMGTWFSEPISSMMYALASELGRENNDLLWLAIVGVTSMELSGRTSAGVAVSARVGDGRPVSGWLGVRGARIRQLFRDEVRRLNPPEITSGRPSPESTGIIPTTARSPEDTSIRLSPEPKLLLVRHWSLYDSMLHSPFLFSRLKTWSETGLKRLHKLLAKMGVSLVQCRQSYTHMDMQLKRELRTKLLKYAALYNLDELVPSIDTDGKDRAGAKDGWGFVRSWGWRATLSAQDVGIIIGALLEVGKEAPEVLAGSGRPILASQAVEAPMDASARTEEWMPRFWQAYDALGDIESLKAGLPTAKYLHKAIFTTGTTILKKKQITHLRAFRMCVVKDSPDTTLFNHPGALTKLALWIGEALTEQEKDSTGKLAFHGRGTPFVVAKEDQNRGVYVVVGTGGGGGPDSSFLDRGAAKKKALERAEREKRRKFKEQIREEKRAAKRAARGENEESETESEASSSDEDEDDDDDEDLAGEEKPRGYGLNKFGTAFQDVVQETGGRVRIDSFEHCVVEVKMEDLAGFLESLSLKSVVG
ncbi:CDC45 family [Rhypophila decipiens]|uniref:CDC45 family n=1 Tax=Rhypophila decipiens TaxID=261697 RepID=A0AAN6YD07_9PEZI|nr:CDC45 family [Rhypophila decipiens]